MAAPLRLVVGLGNPGREYVRTRHNAGFWFVDALAAKLAASFGHEAKFSGEIAKAGDVRLAKPMTYMNLSGRCVAPVAKFYGIAPDEILVVHDELDLKPGEAKMKLGGGHAGHNGLRDIQSALGTPQFWRLRIGIGHPRDSELTQQEVVDYVLKPPRAEELTGIEAATTRALDAWPAMAAGDMERAMMALHTKEKPPKPAKADDAKKESKDAP